MKKTAIILGASGLTGGCVLDQLAKDDRYDSIKLISRSKLEGLPPKVTQYIGDLLQLDQFKSDFTADEVYCCIGTTTSKTPDKDLYRQIDYGIPVAAARLAKAQQIPKFLVISAMGADEESRIFYNRTKGEMEADVLKQDVRHTYIFRPALIGGDRDEKRTMEQLGLRFFELIQPLLVGPLKKYQIIEAETIARAMIHLANDAGTSETIFSSEAIKAQATKTTTNL